MKIHPSDTTLEEVLFLLEGRRHDSLRHVLACPGRKSMLGALSEQRATLKRRTGGRPLAGTPAPSILLGSEHFDYGAAISRSESLYLRRAHSLQIERDGASVLLSDLLALRPEKRQLVVANSPRFHTWGVYELTLERSWSLRGVNRAQSEDLAMLALDLSRHLDAAYYTTELIEDLRARAWTYIANLRRIASDFDGADVAFKSAYAHLKLGTRDPLERAMYLDLKASLRTAQRRFPESIAFLTRAVTIFLHQGDTHRAGKSLVNLANVYSYAVDDAKALSVLEQALPLIDPAQDERLLLCARHNFIDYLATFGRFIEARGLFRQTLPLYLKYNDLEYGNKRLWIKARIAHGFGQIATAEPLYRAAKMGFVAAENAHEAAMVSIELAILYVEQGRMVELKELALEMLSIFSSRNIHREALAAVMFLKQATDAERLNLATTEVVIKFARRALVDPTLKFEASSVLLG